MVVDTALSETMLARLAKIDASYKEDGAEDDPTRLVKAWGGALPEDKAELERLVTDEKLAGTCTASKVREEYPKFRIYTTACVQTAIGNARKKKKKAILKRAKSESVLCFVFTVLYLFLILIVYCSLASACRKWRR